MAEYVRVGEDFVIGTGTKSHLKFGGNPLPVIHDPSRDGLACGRCNPADIVQHGPLGPWDDLDRYREGFNPNDTEDEEYADADLEFSVEHLNNPPLYETPRPYVVTYWNGIGPPGWEPPEASYLKGRKAATSRAEAFSAYGGPSFGRVLSFGGGVDSWSMALLLQDPESGQAMLDRLFDPEVELPVTKAADGPTAVFPRRLEEGWGIDLILFAETGNEFPETYAYMNEVVVPWTIQNGIPFIRVKLSHAKYDSLLHDYGVKGTQPFIHGGLHHCSVKWKLNPQRDLKQHLFPAGTKELIGYNADEYVRAAKKGITEGVDLGQDIDTYQVPEPVAHYGHKYIPKTDKEGNPIPKRDKVTGEALYYKIGMKKGQPKYETKSVPDTTTPTHTSIYPMQLMGLTRPDEEKLIRAYGFPIPRKSSCFFCPAALDIEFRGLYEDHPTLWLTAMAFEDEIKRTYYRGGRGTDWTDKDLKFTGNKETNQWRDEGARLTNRVGKSLRDYVQQWRANPTFDYVPELVPPYMPGPPKSHNAMWKFFKGPWPPFAKKYPMRGYIGWQPPVFARPIKEGKVAALFDFNPAMTKAAREYISKKIKKLLAEGYPQNQAVAIAYSMARRQGYSVPEQNPPPEIWDKMTPIDRNYVSKAVYGGKIPTRQIKIGGHPQTRRIVDVSWADLAPSQKKRLAEVLESAAAYEIPPLSEWEIREDRMFVRTPVKYYMITRYPRAAGKKWAKWGMEWTKVTDTDAEAYAAIKAHWAQRPWKTNPRRRERPPTFFRNPGKRTAHREAAAAREARQLARIIEVTPGDWRAFVGGWRFVRPKKKAEEIVWEPWTGFYVPEGYKAIAPRPSRLDRVDIAERLTSQLVRIRPELRHLERLAEADGKWSDQLQKLTLDYRRRIREMSNATWDRVEKTWNDAVNRAELLIVAALMKAEEMTSGKLTPATLNRRASLLGAKIRGHHHELEDIDKELGVDEWAKKLHALDIKQQGRLRRLKGDQKNWDKVEQIEYDALNQTRSILEQANDALDAFRAAQGPAPIADVEHIQKVINNADKVMAEGRLGHLFKEKHGVGRYSRGPYFEIIHMAHSAQREIEEQGERKLGDYGRNADAIYAAEDRIKAHLRAQGWPPQADLGKRYSKALADHMYYMLQLQPWYIETSERYENQRYWNLTDLWDDFEAWLYSSRINTESGFTQYSSRRWTSVNENAWGEWIEGKGREHPGWSRLKTNERTPERFQVYADEIGRQIKQYDIMLGLMDRLAQPEAISYNTLLKLWAREEDDNYLYTLVLRWWSETRFERNEERITFDIANDMVTLSLPLSATPDRIVYYPIQGDTKWDLKYAIFPPASTYMANHFPSHGFSEQYNPSTGKTEPAFIFPERERDEIRMQLPARMYYKFIQWHPPVQYYATEPIASTPAELKKKIRAAKRERKKSLEPGAYGQIIENVTSYGEKVIVDQQRSGDVHARRVAAGHGDTDEERWAALFNNVKADKSEVKGDYYGYRLREMLGIPLTRSRVEESPYMKSHGHGGRFKLWVPSVDTFETLLDWANAIPTAQLNDDKSLLKVVRAIQHGEWNYSVRMDTNHDTKRRWGALLLQWEAEGMDVVTAPLYIPPEFRRNPTRQEAKDIARHHRSIGQYARIVPAVGEVGGWAVLLGGESQAWRTGKRVTKDQRRAAENHAEAMSIPELEYAIHSDAWNAIPQWQQAVIETELDRKLKAQIDAETIEEEKEERPPRFEKGDRVIWEGRDLEVWSVGPWDDYVGAWRYHLMDPETRWKVWALDSPRDPLMPKEYPEVSIGAMPIQQWSKDKVQAESIRILNKMKGNESAWSAASKRAEVIMSSFEFQGGWDNDVRLLADGIEFREGKWGLGRSSLQDGLDAEAMLPKKNPIRARWGNEEMTLSSKDFEVRHGRIRPKSAKGGKLYKMKRQHGEPEIA